MGSAKAPKAPDYSALAKQQAELDRQTAIDITAMNRINQIDPYGQTTYSQTKPSDRFTQAEMDDLLRQYQGAQASGNFAEEQRLYNQINGKGEYAYTPTYTQTTTLSPAQQALLEQQQGLQGQQNTRISELLSSFQTPTLGAQRQLKDANQNDIQNLLYGQITKQYDDRFAREEASQRAQLANQGFQMGSEGYQNTLSDFAKEKNSAYQDAATQAALSSYDQLNRERQLNQSEYGLLSSDDLGRYNTQMGYLSQLLGGVQGPTTPQYQPFAQATPYESPDQLGAAQAGYQAKVGNANAKNAQKGQTVGTVGTIATAAAVVF